MKRDRFLEDDITHDDTSQSAGPPRERRGAGSEVRILLALPAAVYVLLHLLAYVDPSRLWGAGLLTYYPTSISLIFVVVPLGFALWPQPSLPPGILRLLSACASRRRLLPVVGLLCVPLLYGLRVRAHTLGDSVKWFSLLRTALLDLRPLSELEWHNAALAIPGLEFVNFQQALDLIVHYGVYAAGFQLFAWEPVDAYAWISCVAGGFYVVALAGLARRLDHRITGKLAVFGLFVTLGTVQLFFGYGESYTLVTMLTAFYLIAAVDTVKGRRRPWTAGAVLALAVATHMLAVALVPSWLYLLWRDPVHGARLRRLRLPLAGLGLAATGAIYLLLYRDLHLPLWQVDEPGRYPLLSLEHAATLGNELLLVCPFGLLWGFAGLRDRPANPLRSVLGWATWVPCLLIGVHDIILGGRDWDLMSFPALPCAAWGFVALQDRFGQGTPRLLVRFVLPVMALHTCLWVGVNATEARATARLEHLLEHTNQPVSYRHWTRGVYYHRRGKSHLEETEAAFATAPADQVDTPGTRAFELRKYHAVSLARLGRLQEAREQIHYILRREPQPEPETDGNNVAMHFEWARVTHRLAAAAFAADDSVAARRYWTESAFALERLVRWRDSPGDSVSLAGVRKHLERTRSP